MRINRGVSTGSPARTANRLSRNDRGSGRTGVRRRGVAPCGEYFARSNEPSWLLASATVGNLEPLLGGLLGSDQADGRLSPVYVDSGRPLRARSGRSPSAWRTGPSDPRQRPVPRVATAGTRPAVASLTRPGRATVLLARYCTFPSTVHSQGLVPLNAHVSHLPASDAQLPVART